MDNAAIVFNSLVKTCRNRYCQKQLSGFELDKGKDGICTSCRRNIRHSNKSAESRSKPFLLTCMKCKNPLDRKAEGRGGHAIYCQACRKESKYLSWKNAKNKKMELKAL